MLRLSYDPEIAWIKDDGSVEYKVRSNETGCLVVTEAPSETIKRLVTATMPIVLDVEASTVVRLKEAMRLATEHVTKADIAVYAAKRAAQQARSVQSAFENRLRTSVRALQFAKLERGE